MMLYLAINFNKPNYLSVHHQVYFSLHKKASWRQSLTSNKQSCCCESLSRPIMLFNVQNNKYECCHNDKCGYPCSQDRVL